MSDPTRTTLSRRRLLAAAGVAGVGVTGVGAAAAINRSGNGDTETVTSTKGFVPFQGDHQSGIVTPHQQHGLVAAFNVTARDRESLIEMFKSLTATTRDVMAGRSGEVRDALLPPDDNLILSPQIDPDALTITLAVGESLFDDRFGLTAQKPTRLVRMPAFPNDEPHPDTSHGDLLIQICADHDDTCTHALRRLMRTSRKYLTLRWMLSGFVRPNELPHGRTSVRNLLGFKDGTANLDTTDIALMNQHVWVQPGDDEPKWTAGGSYMAVRVIRNRVEFWDRTALRTQELIIGRSKASGAPLDGSLETDVPRYSVDPDARVTPMSAHIRLANPRTTDTESSLLLRRGFNYSLGFTPNGQLDQGLLFVCFQRDLAKGFIAVQERLNGEALEEYIKPIGGGFYFALPGVARGDGWLGEDLLS
ncbi:MAG: iron uptake transporter deferrochelatase/peroxidase subunit [Acidimicrobiales bacterium]